MYIWDFSRSVGAGSATIRNTRGLTRSVMRLMVPPLPAVSRPSKTMQTLAPVAFTHSCRATSSPCRSRICFSYSFVFILGVAAASSPDPSDTCGDTEDRVALLATFDFFPIGTKPLPAKPAAISRDTPSGTPTGLPVQFRAPTGSAPVGESACKPTVVDAATARYGPWSRTRFEATPDVRRTVTAGQSIRRCGGSKVAGYQHPVIRTQVRYEREESDPWHRFGVGPGRCANPVWFGVPFGLQ